MRAIGFLIAACIALALLQAAAKVLILLLPVAAIISLIKWPRETLALAVILGVTGIIRNQPATLIVIIGVIIGSCLIAKLIERFRGGG